MLKYPLAIFMLVSLASVSQAQSGSRGGPAIAPPDPAASQGSGTRAQGNSAPAMQGAPADGGYATPNSGSGTRGGSMPAPYAQQSATYAAPMTSPCGRVYSYSVPAQTYHAPRVYYRPYYGRSYYGRRHRCFGY